MKNRILHIDFSLKELLFISLLKCLFFFLFPLIILILPESYFDQGKSICISQLFFHQECLACGMTRACMYLIHFNFEEAFRYNMMSYIALPAVIFLWIKWTIEEFKKTKSIFASIKAKA